MTASFFIDISQIDWIAQILWRVLPCTQRVVLHTDSWVSTSPSPNSSALGFVIGEPSLELVS